MGDKPIHMQRLAERVCTLRHRKKLSQRALAHKAGMSPTTLSHIEKLHADSITVEHLVGLANVLEATPDMLLGYIALRDVTDEKRAMESELCPTGTCVSLAASVPVGSSD